MMIGQSQVEELLHSLESFRIERTVSTAEFDISLVTAFRVGVEQRPVECQKAPSVEPMDKVTERVTEKVTEKVTENQRAILELLRQNPRMTQLQLAEKISMSRRYIASNIRALVERGFLRRVGPDKGGYWEAVSR